MPPRLEVFGSASFQRVYLGGIVPFDVNSFIRDLPRPEVIPTFKEALAKVTHKSSRKSDEKTMLPMLQSTIHAEIPQTSPNMCELMFITREEGIGLSLEVVAVDGFAINDYKRRNELYISTCEKSRDVYLVSRMLLTDYRESVNATRFEAS